MWPRLFLTAILVSRASQFASAQEEKPPGRVIARLPTEVQLGICEPAFSPGGKQVAYEALIEDKSVVIFGNDVSDPCDVVEWLEYSPSSGALASLVVVNGKYRLTVGKKALPDCESIKFPEWTPDGAHVAYAAKRDGQYFLVLDGKEDGPWDDVIQPQFEFSKDGATLSFGVYTKQRFRWVEVKTR